jgi:hypothetical protein
MNSTARRFRRVSNERGMALPMTMIVLTLITTLSLAFLALAATEPVIASNHMASSQARAMAESGIERALWALSSGAVPDPLPNPPTAGAPYDGANASFIAMNDRGGFTVRIENGAGVNERIITAVGYVPNTTTVGYVPNASNYVARKEIRLTATRFKKLDPPCAICAGGEQPISTTTDVRIGGSAEVRASEDSGASYCADAPLPQAAVMSQGTVTTNGSPDLTAPPGGYPSVAGASPETFSGFLLSDDDMAMLKAMAKAQGTYLQGSQTFSSPPPGGLVFIDTPSGNPFTSASPSSDIIDVDVHGNWSQGWSGWLIVAGSVRLSGNITMTGLLYAQNDVTLHGTGSGGFTGAVISTNRMDTTSSRVSDDTLTIGNAPTTYNCPAVRDGGGTISQKWFTKPGTFREVGA